MLFALACLIVLGGLATARDEGPSAVPVMVLAALPLCAAYRISKLSRRRYTRLRLPGETVPFRMNQGVIVALATAAIVSFNALISFSGQPESRDRLATLQSRAFEFQALRNKELLATLPSLAPITTHGPPITTGDITTVSYDLPAGAPACPTVIRFENALLEQGWVVAAWESLRTTGPSRTVLASRGTAGVTLVVTPTEGIFLLLVRAAGGAHDPGPWLACGLDSRPR